MQEKKDDLFNPDSGLTKKEHVDYVLNYIIDLVEKANNTFGDRLANPPGDIDVDPEWYEEAIGVNFEAINISKSIKQKLEQEEPLTYGEMCSILEIMYELGASDENIRQRERKTWLMGAKVGDTIYDKLTETRGKIEQIKPSPEGSILCIRFDKKLVKINLIKEMQEPRRYYRE